jgi:hypothetical protein
MVDPWIDVASRLGIPVALLAAVFYALWRVIQWFGINIALPVRDRSFGFLDKLELVEESDQAESEPEPEPDSAPEPEPVKIMKRRRKVL